MRSVNEILETQKSCNPGDMAVEIFDLSYKIRNEIPLTKEEQELKETYFSNKRHYGKVVNNRRRD